MASVIVVPDIPAPSSAIRIHESGPSKLIVISTCPAFAAILLSTMSATAWTKSYPTSRNELIRRFADGMTSTVDDEERFFEELISRDTSTIATGNSLQVG